MYTGCLFLSMQLHDPATHVDAATQQKNLILRSLQSVYWFKISSESPYPQLKGPHNRAWVESPYSQLKGLKMAGNGWKWVASKIWHIPNAQEALNTQLWNNKLVEKGQN